MPRIFTMLLLLFGAATARLFLTVVMQAPPEAAPVKRYAPRRPAAALSLPVFSPSKEAQHLGTVPSEQAWNTG